MSDKKGICGVGRIAVLFSTALMFLSAGRGYSQTQPQSARAIAQKAFPSVVLIMMEDANGQPLSLGSGFFVKGGMLATNFHVIKGASRGYIRIVGQQRKYDISGVVAVSDIFDLALLGTSLGTGPGLPMGDSDKISIGDTVYAVGNPQGLEGTFSQGIISGIRVFAEGKLFQLTAPISPGSSGGPILDSRGDVIGIAAASFKEGQNLNFAIPAAYLSQLVLGAKGSVPLTSVPASANSGGANREIGGKSSEGVVGEKFLWYDYYNNTGDFTITVRNRLGDAVTDVVCLVIFYGDDGAPLEISDVKCYEIIPGGLARRALGHANSSVKRFTTPLNSWGAFELTPYPKRVEIRILDFKIVE